MRSGYQPKGPNKVPEPPHVKTNVVWPGRESTEDRLAEALRERDAASATALRLLSVLERLVILADRHISPRIIMDAKREIRRARGRS